MQTSPEAQSPRNPLNKGMGPISLIRREDGRVTSLPDLTAFWKFARMIADDPSDARLSIKDFKITTTWLSFCQSHTLALQYHNLQDVHSRLSCPSHGPADKNNCIHCAILQNIVHLWLWDDRAHDLLTATCINEGEAIMHKVSELPSLRTLALPHMMLEKQILQLRYLTNLREVKAVRMKFSPQCAVSVSWSFEMPECHQNGHADNHVGIYVAKDCTWDGGRR